LPEFLFNKLILYGLQKVGGTQRDSPFTEEDDLNRALDRVAFLPAPEGFEPVAYTFEHYYATSLLHFAPLFGLFVLLYRLLP
jgi:hypothetical protein